jgi:hypothetical protein
MLRLVALAALAAAHVSALKCLTSTKPEDKAQQQANCGETKVTESSPSGAFVDACFYSDLDEAETEAGGCLPEQYASVVGDISKDGCMADKKSVLVRHRRLQHQGLVGRVPKVVHAAAHVLGRHGRGQQRP